MDVQDLTDALTRHEPDPDAVMASFRAKRRARRGASRRRLVAAGSGLLVVVAVVALVGVLRHAGETAQGAADGCGADPLRTTFSNAHQAGASIILGKGSLTGKHAASSTELIYYQMALTSVRTLSGPTVHSGTTGWISSNRGPSGPIPGPRGGPLWGTDGSLFALVWPQQNTPNGGLLFRVVPVVQGDVIFNAADCWDTSGLPTRPFHGPLASIPGTEAYARASEAGLQAVSLATVEHLAGAAH